MKGSIRQRVAGSGRWEIRWSVGDAGGGKKYHQKTLCGSRRDAERRLREVLTEVDRGSFIEPMKVSLGEFFESWHTERKTVLSAYTYRRYSAILAHQIKPHLGAVQLKGLSRPQMVVVFKAFFVKMERQGGAITAKDRERRVVIGRPLCTTTCRQIFNFMHAAFEQAIREGTLMSNPLNGVEPPRVRKVEVRAIERHELKKLIEAMRGGRFYVPTLLGGLCGMRRSEVLALRWSDLRFDDGTIIVRRALQQSGSLVEFKATKSGKDRTISMPGLVAETLRMERTKARLRRGPAFSESDLIISYRDGAVWPPESFTPRFTSAARKAGFPSLHFHALRHTAITLWLSLGVAPKVVQEMAGHHSAAFTLDRYGHVTPNLQRDAVERLDAAFREAAG